MLIHSSSRIPPQNVRRLEKSWAYSFLEKVLPLIDDKSFAVM